MPRINWSRFKIRMMKDSNCDVYVKSMSEILSRKLSQLLTVANRVGKTLETLSSQPRSFLSRNRSRLFTSPTYTRRTYLVFIRWEFTRLNILLPSMLPRPRMCHADRWHLTYVTRHRRWNNRIYFPHR